MLSTAFAEGEGMAVTYLGYGHGRPQPCELELHLPDLAREMLRLLDIVRQLGVA